LRGRGKLKDLNDGAGAETSGGSMLGGRVGYCYVMIFRGKENLCQGMRLHETYINLYSYMCTYVYIDFLTGWSFIIIDVAGRSKISLLKAARRQNLELSLEASGDSIARILGEDET